MNVGDGTGLHIACSFRTEIWMPSRQMDLSVSVLAHTVHRFLNRQSRGNVIIATDHGIGLEERIED